MAKVQYNQPAEVAAPVEPVAQVAEVEAPQEVIAGEHTMTIYGMTVGGIVEDARVSIEAKDEIIKTKDEEIERLNCEVNAAKRQPRHFTDAEIAKAVGQGGEVGLKKLPDGSVSLRVRVPEEVALPLLSQAESAGEPAEIFIQKQVDEALLAYTCS